MKLKLTAAVLAVLLAGCEVRIHHESGPIEKTETMTNAPQVRNEDGRRDNQSHLPSDEPQIRFLAPIYPPPGKIIRITNVTLVIAEGRSIIHFVDPTNIPMLMRRLGTNITWITNTSIIFTAEKE